MFKALFSKNGKDDDPHALYGVVVATSRDPIFFAKIGVPDTFDGRFEMMILHLYLVIHRLKDEEVSTKKLQQNLFDEFFDDMSIALREVGVGDTIVPKRLKKMSRVFFGRAGAWDEAWLEKKPVDALTEVLLRNLFPDDVQSDNEAKTAKHLAKYMLQQSQHLKSRSLGQIVAAQNVFEIK